jgi:hypothetical protein
MTGMDNRSGHFPEMGWTCLSGVAKYRDEPESLDPSAGRKMRMSRPFGRVQPAGFYGFRSNLNV